jgi:hypothetical protein
MNSETGTSLKLRMLHMSKREMSIATCTRRSSSTRAPCSRRSTRTNSAPRRRALWRADRRLRVDQPPGRHRDAAPRLLGGGGVLRALHLGGLVADVRHGRLPRAVEAARPGEDLRDRRIHQVAFAAVTARTARFLNLVMPRTIARLPYGAATVADRGIQLRGGSLRRRRQAEGNGAPGLLLDERGLCDGRAPHRRLLAIRLLRRHPRCGRRWQGVEPADPRLHLG